MGIVKGDSHGRFGPNAPITCAEAMTLIDRVLNRLPESRDDLRAEYQARYDVIAKYAPQQMGADEIRTYLEEKFAEVLATKNKGPSGIIWSYRRLLTATMTTLRATIMKSGRNSAIPVTGLRWRSKRFPFH